MTTLDRVRIARERRDSAQDDYENADAALRRALAAAHEDRNSLRTLAEASGLTFSGVRYLLQKEKKP